MRLKAPFSLEQRRALDRRQLADPVLCPRRDTEDGGFHRADALGRVRGQLVVTGNGLICPECGYSTDEAEVGAADVL